MIHSSEKITDEFQTDSIQFAQLPLVASWPPVGCAVQQEEAPKKRFLSLADTCAGGVRIAYG